MTSIATWFRWPKGGGSGDSPQPPSTPPEIPGNAPGSGPRPGGGRRPVSEEPKPGSADSVFAALERLEAAQAGLKAERAAQAKRVAALGQCERGLLQEQAKDIADVQRAIDDAMKRFEELQEQLKQEVGNSLNQMAKFNEDYNKAWNKGMDGLDKYLHTYLQLLPGLKNLFDTFVDRNTALEMGHAIDEKIHQAIGAVMAVEGAAGLVRGVAKWVMEDVALEGAEGAAALGTREGMAGLESEADAIASKGAQKGALEAGGKEAATEGVEGGEGITPKAKGESFDTVKGGGEGRPPDWETQKLGPDGKPVEAPATGETKTLPGERTEVQAPNDPEFKATLDQAKARQEAAERALQKANDQAVQQGYKDAADMQLKEAVKREQEQLRQHALDEIKAGQQAQHPITGNPYVDTIYDVKQGETAEAAADRYALRNSLDGTKFNPDAAEVNLNANQYQLEDLVTGQSKTLEPNEKNLRELYRRYEEALNNVKEGTTRFNDYWDRMDPDTASTLKYHLENGQVKDLDYWLMRLKQLGR